jgi:hypothetical protein
METFCTTLRDELPEFVAWRAALLEGEREIVEQAKKQRELEQAERDRKERIRRFEEDRARLERERIELLSQQQQHHAAPHGALSPSAVPNGTPVHASTPRGNEGAAAATPPARPPPVPSAPASAASFIQHLAKQPNPDTSLTVERGGVIRVRVPNPRPGTTVISWSFCTENYDIGFGLEYEVAKEGDGDAVIKAIRPVARVDATNVVSTGQHCENTPGFWCLVFDNSYDPPVTPPLRNPLF